MKDLAIIGAGIAGVSAAVYAKRSGLDFVIFEDKMVGGQILFMEKVDNYVGMQVGSYGSQLAQNLAQTLKDLEIEPINEKVIAVEVSPDKVSLSAAGRKYEAKSLILATGASFKKLGAPGEDRLTGKGVSYCAICDGFFFKNKDVAVVGGGNTAVEEALYLSDICRKVYLIHRRDSLRAMDYLQKKALEKQNIEIIFDSVVSRINGRDVLEDVEITNLKANKPAKLNISGIFLAIGFSANTDFIKNAVKLDESGLVVTDEGLKTSSDLIWACGDCRKRPLRQLITAASEGALAVIGAYRKIKGQYISV